jgi:transcriptional regulator with XRE-family HTH domain
MISSAQCRMARAALSWSVRELAAKAEITPNTVSRFETGQSSGYASTVASLQRVFEAAGITFLNDDGNGDGIRLR